MSEWISVGDRMPELRGEFGLNQVIVAYSVGSGSMKTGYAIYRQWLGAKTEKGRAPRFEDASGRTFSWRVTHWMPLPEPPECKQ